ncbi:MAG: hypothetical protein R6W85_11720 [Gillisia sp.]
MKEQILIVTFTLFYLLGYSQNNEMKYPDFIGQNLSSIENNTDWEILRKAAGDLDNDQLEDLTIILESKDSIPEKRCSGCNSLKKKARIILVLLNKNGDKNVIIQNNRFIARGDEGGMAYYIEPELEIENQLLTIFYQYTRSNQSYTFEFKNGQMVIISAESNGVESASGNFESDKFDFIKGEILTKTGNVSQEADSTGIIKINIKPKSLSDFENMYVWKIAENKYL